MADDDKDEEEAIETTRLLPLTKRNPIDASSLGTNTTSSGSNSSSASHDDEEAQQQGAPSALDRRALFASIKQASQRLSRLIEEHTGSIGMLGSISIAVNSLTGPAMVEIPATFARSGLIPTCLTIVLVGILAATCSLHLAHTIRQVPNNVDYQKHVEYSDVFGHFWGRNWFWTTQLLFFGCISCLNISSIVDTAQVVDTFLAHWMPGGGTAALRVVQQQSSTTTTTATTSSYYYQHDWIRWDYTECSHFDLINGNCVPFQQETNNNNDDDEAATTTTTILLLTAGKLVTTALFLPLALLDLKENAAFQVLAFVILLVTSLQFCIQFSMWSLSDNDDLDYDYVPTTTTTTTRPIITTTTAEPIIPNYDNDNDDDTTTITTMSSFLWGHDWTDLLGVVLFNFALVLVVPAWLYEREPHVDVSTVITSSILLSACLYMAVGILGAWAMPAVSDNMLESMLSGAFGMVMQFGASIFAFAIIGLGIPLFSVLQRLNLTGSGLCSRSVGNVLAVYLPFGCAWVLTGSGAVTKLLSWGGVIFTSLIAFILPLALTIYTVRQGERQRQQQHGDDDAVVVGSSVDGVWCFQTMSQSAQLKSLWVLLSITVLAIVVAVGGPLLSGGDVPS